MGRIQFEVSRQACRFLDPTRGSEPCEKVDEEGFASFNSALYGLEGDHIFTVHCRLSPRFLLSNTLGTSDVNYFEISHAEPLAFFYPEAAARSLRERFEDSERGGPR